MIVKMQKEFGFWQDLKFYRFISFIEFYYKYKNRVFFIQGRVRLCLFINEIFEVFFMSLLLYMFYIWVLQIYQFYSLIKIDVMVFVIERLNICIEICM